MPTPSATTKNANPQTEYTYNYTYLPPLAMVDVVPPAEGFSARRGWILLVARSGLRLLINAIMIGIDKDGGFFQFVAKLVEALKRVAGQLKAGAEQELLSAIDSELEKVGFPTTLPKLEAFMEGVVEKFAVTVSEETLGDLLQIILKLGIVVGPAS